MRYNERIRQIREDHSLTQQKIADILHIGQRTYADYESGKTRIPIDNLLVLARFYNVSLDYITGASDIKSEYPIKQAATLYMFITCFFVLTVCCTSAGYVGGINFKIWIVRNKFI